MNKLCKYELDNIKINKFTNIQKNLPQYFININCLSINVKFKSSTISSTSLLANKSALSSNSPLNLAKLGK